MVWQEILQRFGRRRTNDATTARKRRLLLEQMERRELLASNIGAISGVAFVDQANDGSEVGDPAIPTNTRVELYADTNGNGLFDIGPDLLRGTDFTDAGGGFRFVGLSVGDYFLVQEGVVGLITPAPLLVTVTNDAGVQVAAIDSYETATAPITADSGTPLVTSFTAAAEAIGGERDAQVTHTSGTSDIELEVDATGDTLTISSGTGTVGQALVQYDGIDGTITLDATGLGGADLSTGDLSAGLEIAITGDNPGGTLTVTVYTDATDFSSTVIAIPNTGVEELIFVPFSTFSIAGGSGADFDDVGAIEASIVTVANLDVSITIIESLRPDDVIANLANIQTLELGGMLFSDTSAIGQNNGFREGSEAGIGTVIVELYQLAAANDVVDPTTTAFASTTTAGNGTYSFSGLIPGHYAVVVPASEFVSTASLDGFANSTGNDPANDPDDDVDNDDNGTTLPSTDVISGTISLVSNNEPTNDDDTDANTNTTLDLGFFSQTDLTITKTLDIPQSNVIAGGNAVFDIIISNNGPLDATSVEFQDVIPTGLIFAGTQNHSGSFTTNVVGSTVTVQIGTLPNGTTASFELLTNIAPTQTADITNTATVSAAEFELDPSDNSEDEFLNLISTDLRIAKTDLTDPVDAGTQLTYQITVTNDGPDDASGVTVVDPLPTGVSFVGGDVDGDTGLVNFNTFTGEVTAVVGSLANGNTANITIIVDVATDAASPLSNSATVSASPATDPDLSNNTANEDTTVDRSVDVAVTKTVSGTQVAGRDVTYTLNVTNVGPSEARNVSVTDTLDANLTLVPGSFNPGTSGATFSQVGQTLTFDIGDLDASETAIFSFDVTIASSAITTIPNSATATTTDTDTDSSNDSDTTNIVAAQEIDLVLIKDVDLTTAVPGSDQLQYTITVSHDTDSPSDATNVVITDVLPAGLINPVITGSVDSSNIAGDTITVGFNTIPAGTSRSFVITVDVDEAATGVITNPASVSSDGTELDPTDNTDDGVTTLIPDFDVSVDKSVDNATPNPLDTIVYTVDLTNTGPSTATGVVLTDTLPAGLTLQSATLQSQSGTVIGTDVIFPAITLASGANAQATLTFTVDADTIGLINNTATIPDLSAAGENDATNNSDSESIDVMPIVDLDIVKLVSLSRAQPTSPLTYTFTVTNSGPSQAVNVQVVDTLPPDVNFVSGTGPNDEALSAVGGVVTVSAGNLDSGGSFSFTIEAVVSPTALVDQINTVVVSSDIADSDSSNNTATALTEVDPLNSTIGGSVFVDFNNDGIRDMGEDAISGVQMVLTGTDFLGNSINVTASTNSIGSYLFTDLPQGTYNVTQIQPSGFRDGVMTVGTRASANIGDNVFSQLVLAADTDAINFNFGELIEPLSKRRFLAST